MYNPTDKSYIQARAIKTGKHKLSIAHQQLVDWVSQQFDVNALDFTCETRETSMGYRQQFISIILETKSECQKIETRNNQVEIAKKFMAYFTSAEAALNNGDQLKNSVFPVNDKPFPEIIVGFHSLEEIELKIAKKKVGEKFQAFHKKYKNHIWLINSMSDNQHPIVFYHTDLQVNENRVNGITQTICDDFLKELKKHDEFNYFGQHSISIRFDSKESFDRDFQSNWHYYFQ